MTFRRSDQQRLSRYSIGGESTIKGNNITWWERRVYPKSSSDVVYTISSTYANRPDLLANMLYGSPLLMSFILQYCSISDVIEEFVEGAQLVLPTKGRLFSELLSKSTR